MLSIFNTVHKFWEEENTVSVNYYELFVDSTDDLPDDVYCFSTDSMRYKIMQGSVAYDISTSDIYMLASDGTWAVQSIGGGGGGGGGEGTVTRVAATDGIKTTSGSPITGSGTLKANLSDYTTLTGNTIYDIGLNASGNLAVKIPTDTTPTSSSNKLVTSGGVYTALEGKQDSLTFDSTADPYDATTNQVATVDSITNAISALNLGSAAQADASDFASATQGIKADSAVQSFSGVTASVSNGVATVTAVPATIISVGALSNGMTGTTQSTSDDSTKLATTAFVHDVVENFPGTVTNVATGSGLTTESGSAITESGTVKANLSSYSAISGDRVYNVGVNSSNQLAVNVPWENTTYESKSASEGGTAVSLVTTGEKYTWNNKATSSDITTAIGNLDVTGTSSFGADKTISAWSETDGKVSISSQNIAITGSQAVLTGYAKTTGNVAASDTVTAAIGKLETKADNNTTNIGKVQTQANWNTNNGVKNLSPISGGTVASGGQVAKMPCNIPAGTYIIRWVSTATTGSSVLTFFNNGTQVAQGGFNNDTELHYTQITLSSSANEIELYTNTANTISDVMVCPKPLHDADSTYEPYALPNTKITPELIELVDSGAKNICNWHEYTLTSTTHRGVSYTNNNDGTVTVNTDSQGSTEADAYANLLTIYTGLPFGLKAGDTIVFASSSDKVRMVLIPYLTDHYGESQAGTKSNPRVWTIPQGITGMVVRLAVRDSGTVVTNEKVSAFICTKAAWDVSQKYVPYRPSYEETVEQVAENENNISKYVWENVTINNLSQLTWTQSANGLYYSNTLNLTTVKTILGYVHGTFAGLKAVAVPVPSQNETNRQLGKFVLLSPTNDFTNTAGMDIRFFGTTD